VIPQDHTAPKSTLIRLLSGEWLTYAEWWVAQLGNGRVVKAPCRCGFYVEPGTERDHEEC